MNKLNEIRLGEIRLGMLDLAAGGISVGTGEYTPSATSPSWLLPDGSPWLWANNEPILLALNE